MGIKIGDINNNKGKARIGNEIENSELDTHSLDIEVGKVDNQEGELDVGNKLKKVKARRKWVWAIIAAGTIVSSITAIYLSYIEAETTEDQIYQEINYNDDEAKSDTINIID